MLVKTAEIRNRGFLSKVALNPWSYDDRAELMRYG